MDRFEEIAKKIAQFYSAEFHDMGLDHEARKPDELEFEEKYVSKELDMIADITNALRQVARETYEECENICDTSFDERSAMKEIRKRKEELQKARGK